MIGGFKGSLMLQEISLSLVMGEGQQQQQRVADVARDRGSHDE
jgi:hypothetical protein